MGGATSQLEFSTHSFFSSMRPISVRKKQGNIATKYGWAQTRTMGSRLKMKVLGTTATTRIRKTMVMMMEMKMKMKVMGEKRLLGTTPTPPDWPFPLWLPHTLHYSFSSSDALHSKYSFPVFFPIFFFYIILIFFP